MRKALLIVGVLALLVASVAGAFAGGVMVGRATAPKAVPTAVATEEPGIPATSTPGQTSMPTVPATPETGGAGEGEAEAAFDYDLLRLVLQLLDQQYYGELPEGKELTYGAIRGMLLALGDPYTSFIEPRIAAILNEDASGEFEGIGAMVRMREDGYLEITSLIPGQPAEQAGVQPGDIIVAVGDQSIVGLGLYEAISYIRGPAGTKAELEIIRSGEAEPLHITVVRARIEVPVVEYRMLDEGVAYVRLTEFDANAAARVEDALEELLAEDPVGLVFDLRDNPGGWLGQAIEVADLFLDEGLVVTQRDSSGTVKQFRSESGDIGEEIPLVVLVNGGSASASEIVAGAIQDRQRGLLVGTKTLGKGSVQLPNELPDGSQLRITIARWFTPNEQPLHGKGLTPDVEVPYPTDTPVGEDPQLDRAIEVLLQHE
ncbi:MAG TPA: S41 family peptidase [Chloroflexi bacterium]|nr:S41 family peptidase [Chloroflexota bacterium]